MGAGRARAGRHVGSSLGLAGPLLAAHVRFLRSCHPAWGATDAEAQGEVAGDDPMPGAGIVSTRVVDRRGAPDA
jgi:hypothetical protein